MSEDGDGSRLCAFPDCTRPPRRGSGRGRPPRYCDLPTHNSVNATRERQRRHLAELAQQSSSIPAPRVPIEPSAGADTAANVAQAHQVAVRLVLASGQAQALADQLHNAQNRIAELTARAERAEAELAEQRRHYEDRLWLLGELPRPTRPAWPDTNHPPRSAPDRGQSGRV